MKLGKKGVTFAELSSVGLLFVLIGVTLAIGTYVLSEIRDTAGWSLASGALENESVTNAQLGINTISEWLPIIGLVIAAGTVIGVLVMAFSGRRGV